MLGHHRRSAEALAKDEERLKEDMEKLYRLYLANEVPSKGFGDKYRPMDERVEQIQNERPTLQGEIDFLRIQYLSSMKLLPKRETFTAGGPKWKRQRREGSLKLLQRRYR